MVCSFMLVSALSLKPILIASNLLEGKNVTKTIVQTFNTHVLLFQELCNTDVLRATWLVTASTAVLWDTFLPI
jgi:hypothetical protein